MRCFEFHCLNGKITFSCSGAKMVCVLTRWKFGKSTWPLIWHLYFPSIQLLLPSQSSFWWWTKLAKLHVIRHNSSSKHIHGMYRKSHVLQTVWYNINNCGEYNVYHKGDLADCWCCFRGSWVYDSEFWQKRHFPHGISWLIFCTCDLLV